MTVDVLYFDGCPSFEALLPRLRALVAEAGFSADAITLYQVESPEAADSYRFLGSPTVRVNGVDVEPGAAERRDYGMKCRIYRSDDGQTHAPPDAWIRMALSGP